MIKLADIINEGQRSRKIHIPKFWAAVKGGKFDDAIKAVIMDAQIYRGIQGTSAWPSYVVNPKQHYRESANTSNFYTGLIDGLPAWKEWPKRSRSIVCTNRRKMAETYGNPLLVLPMNDAKISDCSQPDFCDSFPLVTRRLKTNMDRFNHVWARTFNKVDRELGELTH